MHDPRTPLKGDHSNNTDSSHPRFISICQLLVTLLYIEIMVILPNLIQSMSPSDVKIYMTLVINGCTDILFLFQTFQNVYHDFMTNH